MADQLDTVDLQILHILMRDGRKSNVDISRRVGCAESTVRRRIQNLIERGVMDIVAVTEPSKVGLATQVIIGIGVELSQLRKASEALASFRRIRYLSITTGRFDLIVQAYFPSNDELFKFLVDELPQVPGILRVETSTVLEVTKRTWDFSPEGLGLFPLQAEPEDDST